jgi:hypothetical protein
MKITRLIVRNFRGVEAREADIPPGGAIFAGGNGKGKTSILRALQAALAGRDIAPDAIRLGAEKAEILVDLDDVSVRRVITQKTSSVTVTRDGFKAAKPQGFLDELLGTSAIDACALFLSPPKEQRRQILAAQPMTVTAEWLRRYVPDVADDYDTSGHALEVIDRLRKQVYDARTAANAAAKTARDRSEKAAAEAAEKAKQAPRVSGLTIDAARVALNETVAEVRALEAQMQAAEKSTERTAAARTRIASLRERSVKALDAGVAMPTENVVEAARKELAEARAELARAEQREVLAARAWGDLMHATDLASAAIDAAKAMTAQADELDATLRETAIEAPSTEAVATAREREQAARGELAAATLSAAATAARAVADTLRAETVAAEARASKLDTMVRGLTEAPATLLSEVKGIPGLSLEGDDIMLDGVRLSGLCGAEQMRLAIEIARRANAKSKILMVDGLERLDPDQLETFVRLATADGYQLLASRVAKGEVVLEAIEPEPAAPAATAATAAE